MRNVLLIAILLFAASNCLAADGLDEVNYHRTRRGLRPFIRDNNLTLAAKACSTYRARYRVPGHTYNDFAFVPTCYSDSIPAQSAGCGAWEIGTLTTEGDTWGTCCLYDNYRYAGAWYEIRGKHRYMHLYVR